MGNETKCSNNKDKTHKAWHGGCGVCVIGSSNLKWQHDREFLDNEKFLETKAALQRIQIEHDLDNNLDALVKFLVGKGVI